MDNDYHNADVYVTHIGINRINLHGRKLEQYSNMENAEMVNRRVVVGKQRENIQTVVLNFANEEEMIGFLQNMIDNSVPFADNYKTMAYHEARELINQGRLKGKLIGC